MKYALVFCMILFPLNGTGIQTPDTRSVLNNKQTCSMGITPRLQAYYLKKEKKEKMHCSAQASCFKAAFNNSLRFIDSSILNSLMPCLK